MFKNFVKGRCVSLLKDAIRAPDDKRESTLMKVERKLQRIRCGVLTLLLRASAKSDDACKYYIDLKTLKCGIK